MEIEQKIEAILFYKNEPIEIKKLAKILDIGERETREAIKNLSLSLESRGIRLIQTGSEVCLATAPELKEMIEAIAKDEMSRDIGKAGLETLAIVLYNGPISRREIDYIRGVNSAFILRNLSTRGLIERDLDAKDQRVPKYKGSLALLAHLGLSRAEDLPEFQNMQAGLKVAAETASEDNQSDDGQ